MRYVAPCAANDELLSAMQDFVRHFFIGRARETLEVDLSIHHTPTTTCAGRYIEDMVTDTIRAKGHRNITARHKTTLQITKDAHISRRADCVVGVLADKALVDLSSEVRAALKTNGAKIRFKMLSGHAHEVITGFGSADLAQSDANDIVVRKSGFTSGRTLMIGADKAAADLDRRFVEKLKKSEDIIILVEADFE